MAAAVIAATLCPASVASAAPGDRDPSFGHGGLMALEHAGNPYVSPAVLSDGSIVAPVYAPILPPTEALAFARVDSSGVADRSFGGGDGYAVANVFQADGVGAVAADGNEFIAGGYGWAGRSTGDDAIVARFLSDGTPDPAFGSGGEIRFNVGDNERISALAVAPDQSIVVAGMTSNFGPSKPFVARLRPDGTLDPSFGAGKGYVVDPAATGTASPTSIALTADGGVLIGSAAYLDKISIAKLRADGTLDQAWAGDGVAELPFAVPYVSPVSAANIEVAPGGSVFVFAAASSHGTTTSNSGIEVIKLLANGTLDSSFSGDGWTEFDAHAAGGGEIAADGDLIVGARTAGIDVEHHSDVELLRLLPDGSPDPSFSGDGIVNTDISGIGSDDSPSALALDPDGRIVVQSGSSLLRYLTGPGPADADADGHLDGDDSCPQNFGDVPEGCPTFSVAGLDVAYLRRVDDFQGMISYGDAELCMPGARVTVKRKRHGRDRVVGRSGAPFETPPDIYGEEPEYRWKISALATKGRYYAQVAEQFIPGIGHCGTFRTATLRIRVRS